jgi:hypothetical protein
MSLKVALEQLGFGPCYHMIEIFEHPDHVPLWEAAARGETVDWEEMFTGYRATVDWPGCSFYKELMEAYSYTKVLLNVRASDKWYESARNTIYTTLNIPDPPPGRRVVEARLGADLRWGLRGSPARHRDIRTAQRGS